MPTANEIIEQRKKILESGGSISYTSPKVRTVNDILTERGYRTPESIQAVADAQEKSVPPAITAPVTEKPLYSDTLETQRLKAAANKPAVKPATTGMPSKAQEYEAKVNYAPVPATVPQMSYTDFKKQEYDIDVPAIVAGKKPVVHERANVRPAKAGKVEYENQPSWGKVVGSSLGSGVAQTNVSMFNVPRKIIEGVSIGLDKVLPDVIYDKKMQENDPIKRALDKAVKSNEERAQNFQKDIEGAKGIKGFVAAGLPSLPQIVMAAFGGAALQGGSALAGLPESARQLIPFGTLAAGGYAREAENEGATYGQQVAYGLLGGTAEAATEVIPLGRALDIMKRFGAGEIAEKGAKTLIGKYGKTALQIIENLLLEGAQEGIMSPLGRGAKKITYKPNMPMTGEEGVFDWKDIKDSAYAGISMAAILGGLGLPASYASHKLAFEKIENKEPITPEFIQNELMPALQKDTATIENEATQAAKIQQAPAEFNWALNQIISGKNIPSALESKYPVLSEFRKNLEAERAKPKEIQQQTREKESNAIAEDYNALFEASQEPTAKVENKQEGIIVGQEKDASKVVVEKEGAATGEPISMEEPVDFKADVEKIAQNQNMAEIRKKYGSDIVAQVKKRLYNSDEIIWSEVVADAKAAKERRIKEGQQYFEDEASGKNDEEWRKTVEAKNQEKIDAFKEWGGLDLEEGTYEGMDGEAVYEIRKGSNGDMILLLGEGNNARVLGGVHNGVPDDGMIAFATYVKRGEVKHTNGVSQSPTSEVQDEQEQTIVEQGKDASKVVVEKEGKPAIEPLKNIGYHAGDLGKAEHFGRQYGSSRDTGHFGTGTYFVGDKKNIEIGNYKDRPMHEVDLSDYKLFKPKNESAASKLHELLKYANTYYQAAQRQLVPDDVISDLQYSEPDVIISELKKLGKWDEETFQNYFKISSDEYIEKKLENPDIYRYLKDELVRDLINDNDKIERALDRKEAFEENVESILGIDKDKATEILDNIYADIKKQYGDSGTWYGNKDLDKSDSVSTRFMKALGYEGVDVRHIPTYDNTGYGTVVYDLKEGKKQQHAAEEKPKEAVTPSDKIFTPEELIDINNQLLGRGAPTEYDGMGYNKLDYGFGMSLANQPSLSKKQLSSLAKMIAKYGKTQLGIDPASLMKTAEYYAEVAEEVTTDNLPELSGSDKQISWANKIRAEKLRAMQEFLGNNKEDSDYNKYLEVYNIYKGLLRSRDVIDTRDYSGTKILKEYAKGNNLLKGLKSEGVKDDEGSGAEKRTGQITGLDYRIPIEYSKTGEKDENGLFTTRGGKLRDRTNVLGDEISKSLRKHQIEGVNLAIKATDEYGGFILSDGTGAGKTRQEIAYAQYYLNKGKTVLIVTTNATNISKSFKSEAGALNIALKEVTDGKIENGLINITTYTSLDKISESVDYIVFDESHNLKNKDTAKTKAGMKLADSATGVLFASATPLDKALQIRYLTKTGIFKNRSFTKVMHALGYEYEEKRIGRKTIGEYVRNVTIEEAEKRLSAFFDELADLGLIIKREVPMDKVDIFYRTVKLQEKARDTLDTIYDYFADKFGTNKEGGISGIGQALMLMSQRRFQESFKIEAALDIIHQELREGRKVVVFATRINDTEIAAEDYVYNEDTGHMEKTDTLKGEGTISKIADTLAKEGIKIAKIFGAGNVDKEVDKFQNGDAEVAVVTPQKGGAGLSLDDTAGDKPRTMVVITPPFSGVDNVQMAGRVNRLNTASGSRIIYLFANTDVDDWNKNIISDKMKTLNAVVKGDIGNLDTEKLEEGNKKSAKPEAKDLDESEKSAEQELQTSTEQRKEFAEEVAEKTEEEKPIGGQKVTDGEKELKKQEDNEAIKLSDEELESRISDITRELSKLESDLRNPRTLDKQKVKERISELRTEKDYLSARVSKLVKNPKGNKDKLQNALINEQLTLEGIEISKGKKHGFDHEQREQIAEELIEGSKTDKEKINIKVRNDGTMNVINSEATIADVMDKLGIKKIETKIPYNIDKNVSTRIVADEKNMMVTPDGYYAVYVTAEELQALKELAADKQIEYKTDFKFDDLIKSSENNTIELTDIPKLHKAGRISYYYFKAGDTIYCFDKKLFDIFNKDGNRFYVGGKNTQPATIKDSEGNTIGILLPVRSELSQAEINSLNPATGKEFFTKPKKDKGGVKSSAMTGALPQMPRGDDSATLGGKEGAKSVDEIVSIIEKVIGVPIRTGKFRQKAYGIFKELPEVIRTKVTNDLPVISHEVGHYLDKRFDLAQKQFDSELQILGAATSRKSYTKEQIRAEGVAEFTRLYLTDPLQATIKAPNFLAHFETAVDTELLKELNDLRREIGKVNNLPPTQKILNDISLGESRKSTKEVSVSGFLQKFYDAWIDEFAPITRAYRRAVQGGWVGKNISTMAKAYRGLEAKVKANLKYEQTDLEGNVVGESLESILKPIKKEYKEFITYMVSRRAVDYEDKNFVMPQPYWVYQDNVAAMEAKYSHFKDVFEKLRKWEDNNLQLLVDSGIMTQNTVDEIKKNNPNHVPLYRIQEAVDKIRAGSGNTLGQSKKVIKRAKGSGKTIIDPIESIIADAFIIRRAAEANNILRALADMADSTEGFGDIMEAVPPGIKGTTFNVEEISKTLEDMGIDTEGVDLDNLVTIFRANYSERPNEITVYRNGKPKLYQMESEIYKAIKGLNRQASHFLIRILNVPKRVLQAGAVTTVQFVMRNIARDTGTSLINTEAGINPIDIIKGYASAMKKDKWFKQWIRTGGASEFIQVADRTNVQDLEADILGISFIDKFKELLQNPTKENAMRVLLSPMRAIREGIEWSEAGPRIAEMRKATEKGVPEDEAASWARDLSQDFLRHGYYGKELNKVTAFFNANVQGIEKQIRVFKEHPFRTLIRGLLYVTLPTMLLYFLNDDNEEYKRMAEWRKALFYNIPIASPKDIIDRITTGKPLNNQHFLSIPKPYGWGFIFGALPEIILDEIRHDEPDTWKKIREDFAINFDIPLMPSAVGPAWEVARNKSWNKVPIETQGDKSKPAYLRYNDKTSSISKSIASAAKDIVPISPKQLDYMVKGYTGPVGDFFWRLPDTIKKGIQMPDDYTNYPVVKSFITDTVYSNDTLNRFYDYGTELEERRKEAQETGSYRAIKHLSEDVQNQLAGSLRNARLEYNRIADDFTEARKKIAEINGSDKYTPSEKKLRTREIQMKIIKKAEEYNKKYEKFKKQYEIK